MSNMGVPDGWELRRLGDFCTERSLKFDGKSTIPVLSVTKYDGFVKSLDYFNKQVFSRDLSTYKVVQKGQFAYATIHLDEGSLGLLLEFENGLISPMYTVFRVTDGLDSEFLFFLMKSDIFMARYPALGQGSINRRMSISFKVLADLRFQYPPLPEQQKIAAILTSVDDVIEKTQAQIDKLQDLKKGTMNELLTRGIGHSEFKESPVGMIPVEWEVMSLGSLALKIKRGPSLSTNTQGRGIRYITSGNLVSGEVSLNGDYKFLDDFSNIEKCRLIFDDLILNCVNSAAKIGESAVFEDDVEAIVGFNNYAITLDSAICVPRYIHQFCQTYLFRNQLKTVIKDAINQVSFSTKDLDLIRIALPPLEEQYRISESINVIRMKEKANRRQLDKVQALKKALMQDLLTGKKRVAA